MDKGFARGTGHGEKVMWRGRGFSLVELLVGLAVGLFLTAGIVQILVSSQVTYQIEESFSRLQENGRYAVQTLAEDARQARSMGCRSRSLMLEEVQDTLNVLACDLLAIPDGDECGTDKTSLVLTTTPLGYDASVQGTADWLTSVPAAAVDSMAGRWARGDVLVLWGATAPGLYVDEGSPLTDPTANIVLDAPTSELSTGDLALITDCEGSDIFQISATVPADDGPFTQLAHTERPGGDDDDDQEAAGAAQVNASASLSRFYNYAGDSQVPGTTNKAMVYPFRYSIYYICSGDDTPTGQDSLCRWRPDTGSVDLVSDVYDMRVTYGGDADGDGTLDFFPDDTGNDMPTAAWVTTKGYWPGVYSARVELLVGSSADNVRSRSATPSDSAWPGGDTDRLGTGLPADRRLYERFTVTVALRARTPWYLQE